MNKSLFIVVEGLDGSGKTTQIYLLQERLHALGLEATIHHEPTDGPIGTMIREVLQGTLTLDPSAVAGLYLSDRLDHITKAETGMLADLEAGKHVISSRYYFSSLAFQSEYVPMEWVARANSLCKDMLRADITFYIYMDPEISLERLRQTRPTLDIYENLDKQRHTHQQFLLAFEIFGEDENIVIIDGSKSVEEVSKAIWKHVLQKLAERDG